WKPSTRPLPPDDYPSSRDASADRDRIATRAPLSTTLSPADLGSASGDPAFQAEIDALDFELSTIVTEDSRRWDFRTLSVRCEEAIKQAQNPADRGKIRLIQARMQKFAELRDQEMRLATSTGRAATGTARPTVGSTSSGSTTAISDPFAAITRRSSTAAVAPPANPTSTGLSSLIGTDPLSTESSKFDGIGKLMRVKSQRPNAPKYALVNEENDVVSFVSPAPGVNLQAYEGRYVTVTGQRGFLPELKKGHITAQRVSPALLSQRDGLRRR
ncbi:MAG: hypothetical protein SGJ20_07455, partial [Planctomycetota bacterium]|nr:hypothetical protein [Planctomycetota bacterium]